MISSPTGFGADAYLDHGLLAQIDALRARGLKAELATVQEHERAAYLWTTLGLKDHSTPSLKPPSLARPSPRRNSPGDRGAKRLCGRDIFFIDDKAANIDAARALGWNAAVWDGAAQWSI